MGLFEQIRRPSSAADECLISRRLDASTRQSLEAALRDLAAGERGWITFDDFQRLFEPRPAEPNRSMWGVGTRPPGPAWWMASYSRSVAWAGRSCEWTWSSAPALALAALANREGCTPVRIPTEGRFYFAKDEPERSASGGPRARGA
jgi:hypothetical protein